MGKKFEITSVNFDDLPNLEKSHELLEIIHKKVKPPLLDVSCKIDKPIILHGAGNLGKMAKEYFDILNIKPLFITDKNFYDNEEVLEPCEIPYNTRKLCRVIVCIVSTPFCEIKNYLNVLGFEDIVPFYDVTLSYQDKHPLNNGWITSLLDEKDLKSMGYVLDRLEDNISYCHYLQFIAWHSLREEWLFKNAPILNDDRYFIPEIVGVLSDNETFIDIGAYNGEVSKKFIDITNGKFKMIYAFEPDNYNVNVLRTKCANMRKVFVAQFTISEKCGREKFYHGLNYSSQLSELGNEYNEVDCIDDLSLEPSFIKIHTEGNENEVIKGGLETIKKYRPILVTTCYHNRNGLWKIQTQLMNSNSLENYVYYFRLHNWCGTGAVIYAIPKERL